MKATIKDIAKKAGVSITTVSRVINGSPKGVGEKTRKRVEKVAKELNYSPNFVARSLVMKKTQAIGVIIPDISNPFFPELIRGIEDRAAKENYSLILCNSDGDETKEQAYMKLLKDKGTDGIIYTGVHGLDVARSRFLKTLGVPFVCLDRAPAEENMDSVCDDGAQGMYEMVRYLIQKGHEKIAYFTGDMAASTAKERKKGYEGALKENGICLQEALVVAGLFDVESGRLGVETLIDRKVDFTAIACANDLIAMGALLALRARNISVPAQVSVTGYDDIQMAQHCFPALTTMAQNKYELGKSTVHLLLQKMKQKTTDGHTVTFQSTLILRDSVAQRREKS